MSGDRASFEAFVDREYPPLVRALALYCGDLGVAEELAQDAFARAYQRWRRVGRHDRPDAWVHRVAFNLARSWFRRRYAERRAYARHGPAPQHLDAPEIADAQAVRAAVLALPDRQREVIVHRYFLGRSVAETAEALGVSDGAVKAATFKAIRNLQGELGSVLDTDEEVDHA
jgi:RNA polymerase sigma-70 factor (sigma-E family)